MGTQKKLFLTTRAVLQGGWEDDESIDEAACREAFEEAGVKGVISVGALTCSPDDVARLFHLLINILLLAGGLIRV